MGKRFVSIWFRHLATDWFALSQPHLKKLPFVLRKPVHGRMVIAGANVLAEQQGIVVGMVLADARAIVPDLEVLDDRADLVEKLLKRLAEWCIRFTPVVAVDFPDGLLLDASGCSHLWGGDTLYIREIAKKLNDRGYDVRLAMTDTAGCAWATARFGMETMVIASNQHVQALLKLPPEALRLEPDAIERLHKLGLHTIGQFINMPRHSLRRRFGQHLLMRLDMAIGQEFETIEPVHPIEPYQERLPCLEPIVTASGIEIALKELLTTLCHRLQQEQKGLRAAIFKCYCVDGKIEKVDIGTHQPTHHVSHLFKLFANKLSSIEPGLGIELFALEAPKVEEHLPEQEKMWEGSGGLKDIRIFELIDRLAGRIGDQFIRRYLPDEHHWPERSFKRSSLSDELTTAWKDKPRPLKLLQTPELIEVTSLIPDYPPMLFLHRGKRHKIVKADGPERIEQEWWLQRGQHRDYYRVEDEEGKRYWIFRLGHYHDEKFQWFIHGFFA
ncbi:MAG TPA: DNA polymerase Y family protein [Cyclobacteriaceae bacterium]|nr:DNA polymerase Y family protein [Cyclobacteriaceae bacterium]